MNNDASDTESWPLETYLPDDYIKYAKALNRTVGFEGKEMNAHRYYLIFKTFYQKITWLLMFSQQCPGFLRILSA